MLNEKKMQIGWLILQNAKKVMQNVEKKKCVECCVKNCAKC